LSHLKKKRDIGERRFVIQSSIVTHGGQRTTKWTPESRALYEALLWIDIEEHPAYSSVKRAKNLAVIGLTVTPDYINKTLQIWDLHRKKPQVTHYNKYSPENIFYYSEYCLWVQQIPYEKLKFLDEAHFVHKDLATSSVIGEVGEPTFVVNNVDLDYRVSLTVMTTLSNSTRTVVAQIREDSNTAIDFLRFLIYLLSTKHLTKGDYLVLDNAKVHCSEEILECMSDITRAAEVRIIFLPTYSGELDATEHVFNVCKNHVRHCDSKEPLYVGIAGGLGKVTPDMMRSFYDDCIYGWMKVTPQQIPTVSDQL